MSDFEEGLKSLINKRSIENESNTPDWLLVQYLMGCLAAFATVIQQRENWYGRDPRPKMVTLIGDDSQKSSQAMLEETAVAAR